MLPFQQLASRAIRGIYPQIALILFTLGQTTQAHALIYEWNFERDGGIYSNQFVVDDIFKKALDGEVDIYVEQSGTFNIDSSKVSITYIDGSTQNLDSLVDNPGAANPDTCDGDNFIGCVKSLDGNEVKFQHFFFELKDIIDESDIVSAALELSGSGLDFSDPQLRVRWDWSNHLGVAHNHALVPEPSALLIVTTGLIAFALMRRRYLPGPTTTACTIGRPS